MKVGSIEIKKTSDKALSLEELEEAVNWLIGATAKGVKDKDIAHALHKAHHDWKPYTRWEVKLI